MAMATGRAALERQQRAPEQQQRAPEQQQRAPVQQQRASEQQQRVSVRRQMRMQQALERQPARSETGTTARVRRLLMRVARAWFRGWTVYVTSIRGSR
jgi:hypothetical protein